MDAMPEPHRYVVLGASGSDGLHDIETLLGLLSPSIPAVLMVVLHRPSDRISHLKAVLRRKSKLPVLVAEEAEALQPGACYLGEPDGHLTLIERDRAHLVPGAAHQFRGRTVDVLFASVARHAGPRAIGIVLSGSLADGSRGLADIHHAGGLTMVLTPTTLGRGMQRNAIDYDGPVDVIGSAEDIARAVTTALRR